MPKTEAPKGFISLAQGDNQILVAVAHIVTVQDRVLVMVTQGTVTCDENLPAIAAKISMSHEDAKKVGA